MKKIKLMSILILFSFTIVNFTQCEKKDEKKESTCNNGEQDGDEEGIDCGGSDCDSCDVVYLCQGTPENNFMPTTYIHKYKYTSQVERGGYDKHYFSYTFKTTTSMNGITYHEIEFEDITGWTSTVYNRLNNDGELIEYYSGQEFLVVSDIKPVGYIWSRGNHNFKIISKNASFSSPDGCEYTGLIEIHEFNTNDNSLVRKYFYKKGLGLVGGYYTLVHQYIYFLSKIELVTN